MAEDSTVAPEEVVAALLAASTAAPILVTLDYQAIREALNKDGWDIVPLFTPVPK